MKEYLFANKNKYRARKNFFYYLKFFLPSPWFLKKIWRGIRFILDFIIIKLIWRAIYYIVWAIIYPFRSFKNFIKSLLIVAGVIYFSLSIFVIYDYLKVRYSEYEKSYCQTNTEKKLKKSIVRIVGGFSEGSGFFISGNQILTNFHVIDGEPSPKIIFPDGTFITPVKITGNPDVDLAILYTDASYDYLTFPLPARNSLQPDEVLVAAGYPLGTDISGPPTVIKGDYLEYRKSRKEEVGYIQTDFNLVAGMSGGPLTDLCGNVVGINTMSLGGGQSFFIAADEAKTLIPDFTDKEITKISYDPSKSPEEAVEAYYSYLKTRQMEKGYNLLSQLYLQYTTYEEWTNRFDDILDVQIISAERYKKTKDTVFVKFWTKNWVKGEVDFHYYQGTWKTVVENGIYKMQRSNIEEIQNPDFNWMLGSE